MTLSAGLINIPVAAPGGDTAARSAAGRRGLTTQIADVGRDDEHPIRQGATRQAVARC